MVKLSEWLVDLKGQASISRPYFQSLINSDDYNFLTDPLGIGCQRAITHTVLGFTIEAGYSVVVGMAAGYQGSDIQTVVGTVYEVRPHTFSPQRAHR